VLRTLRLRFASRPEYDLAFESEDEQTDPWELLRSRADAEGRIVLGDRDSCVIGDVLDVRVVEHPRIEGPTWEHGLQDEDVATAVDENYDAQS